MDLAKQVTLGTVATDPVLFRVGPTHGTPHVAVDVAAHTVGDTGLEIISKYPAVRLLPGVDIDVEYADMRRVFRTLRDAGVDVVEALLVGRERDAIWLREVVDNDFDLTGLRIDPVDVVLFLLFFRTDAFIIALDPLTRIGEPDRIIGGYNYIVGEFSFLPLYRPANASAIGVADC